jgi:flagellar biosynthesis protein FlhF
MKLETFTAESPTDALQKARNVLGEDVLIVSTKEVIKKSLNKKPLYEVVCAIDDEAVKPKPTKPSARAVAPVSPSKENQSIQNSKDVLFNLSEVARQIGEVASVDETMPKANKQNKSTSNEPKLPSSFVEDGLKARDNKADLEELRYIKKELSQLGDKLKIVQNIVWDDNKADRQGLVIPPEFAEVYRIIKNSGMTVSHINKIMRLTLENMPFKMRQHSKTIKRYFKLFFKKMVKMKSEKTFLGRKKILMLVGPTGVGKTTTLAKLAAKYSYLNNKNSKVGIIALDSFRIGAVEQLTSYANMMKLPIEVVSEPEDMNNAIENLRHCSYILIDTFGSSQYDSDKISMVDRFLNADLDNQIDVSLVMSANTKLEDLNEIYESFSTLRIDSFIFTKLDETKEFGSIFSFLFEHDDGVVYLSVGQDVPYDLEEATSDYLIDCLFDGFTKRKKD